MLLKYTRGDVAKAPARAKNPAGAAGMAALAGNPALLKEWLASVVKAHCLRLMKDPVAAELAAQQMLAGKTFKVVSRG